MRLHVLGGKAPNGFREQVVERAHSLQHLTHQQGSQVCKRCEQEILLGDFIGLFGGVEVFLHRGSGTRLELLKNPQIRFSVSPDIHILRRFLAAWLEVDPVAGIKLLQI